jgi:dihydropteroate synthase
LEAIADAVQLPISVDTYKSHVAREALSAGASIVNDIRGLKADPSLAEVAAGAGAGLVLMHNQKGTQYTDLLADILTSMEVSVAAALDAGVAKENVMVDPGIGFGKTPDQNIEVLQNLERFKALGYPLLVGASRKSTIGLLLDLPPEERLEGTSATVALAIAGGADIIRVHDVKEMVRVSRVTDAIVRGWRPDSWQGVI